MKRTRLFVLLTLVPVSIISCREAPQVAHRPTSVDQTREALPPDPPGRVLMSEEVQRLRRERPDLIARPTPLGEETDAAAEMQRKEINDAEAMQQKVINDAAESQEKVRQSVAEAEGGLPAGR